MCEHAHTYTVATTGWRPRCSDTAEGAIRALIEAGADAYAVAEHVEAPRPDAGYMVVIDHCAYEAGRVENEAVRIAAGN